jgi:hypothetical protein
MDSRTSNLRPQYNAFLKSEAGQDLLKRASALEKSFVLQGIKAKTSDEKVHAICKLEGLIELRDYIVRMSKAKG